jgi:DHA1 family bicyclomycin/chloramphenicol resistance-like MFS transporter
MQKQKISNAEFVTLMASLMAITALAIDAVLPALDIIGFAVGVQDPQNNQLIIIMIFLGLGLGPLLFGPISDSIGRKPLVYIGFGIFIIASFICIFSKSLEMMIFGRILQGVGLSSPRTISIAMVRDTYDGNYMARIMSFITTVFILIPVIAPALGKFILDHYNWQSIFYIQLIFSILVSIWFFKRQPETLSPKNKRKWTSTIFISGFKELIRHKTTIGFTIISGFITGSFLVYLSTAQQVFHEQYQLVEEFPYIFAALAITVGAATLSNGTLVLRYGMEKLITWALFLYFFTSLIYVVFFFQTGNPSVLILFLFCAVQFFAIGFLFGNLRAIAMQPVGHIAGIASAITGLISTLMAVPISIYIGGFVKTSVLPMFIGFTISSLISIGILHYIKSLRKNVV